jgi:signal peptidase II
VSSAPAKTNGTEPAVGIPRWRYVLFVAIALGGCLADLLTKHWVFQWRGMPRENNVWWIWKGFVGIETALNPGALFGMGAGGGIFFAILSILFGAGILYFVFARGILRDAIMTVALGCILGGMLGNLYDRLGLWHAPGRPAEWHREVRDWILLRYGDFVWPNFNIADSLLVCGVGLVLLHTFLSEQEPANSEK